MEAQQNRFHRVSPRKRETKYQQSFNLCEKFYVLCVSCVCEEEQKRERERNGVCYPTSTTSTQ